MEFPRRKACALVAATALLLLAPAANAAPVTLDWIANPWPATGSLSATFLGVGSGDVDVTFTDTNGTLTTSAGAGAPGSPETNNFLEPTGHTGEDSLFVRASGNDTAPFIVIDFVFSHAGGITNLAFDLFDVDANPPTSWTDEVVIHAFDLSGGLVLPASVLAATGTPSWVFDGTDTVTGQTPNQPSDGPGSDNATVQVTFGTTAIDRLRIEYRNTQLNGVNQWIGISNLGFEDLTPIPEPGSRALVLLGLIGLAAARRRRIRS